MDARIAVEMGRRASELQSRIQGLESLAEHFGARVTSTSSVGLSDRIQESFRDIQGRLALLSTDFLDHGDLVTNEAATTMQRIGRGFLARRRHAKAAASLERWRYRHALDFREASVRYLQALHTKEDMADSLFMAAVGKRLVLGGWKNWLALHEACASVGNMVKALGRVNKGRRERRLCYKILTSWCHVAHSHYSRKAVVARYQARKATARESLIATGAYQVSESMVLDRVELEATWAVRRIMQAHRRKERFIEWKQWTFINAWFRSANAKASAHDADKVQRRVFLGWKGYLEKLRASGIAPKFQKRGNKRKEEIAEQRRLQDMCFHPWADWAQRMGAARRMGQAIVDKFHRKIITAFATVTKKQRKRRRRAIDRWELYSREMRAIPLRVWFIWTRERVQMRIGREHIIRAQSWRKDRTLTHKVFSAWKILKFYPSYTLDQNKRELQEIILEERKVNHEKEQALIKYRSTMGELQQALSYADAEKDMLQERNMEVCV